MMREEGGGGRRRKSEEQGWKGEERLDGKKIWMEREAGGRGEMQIQAEPKTEMKRCTSWERDGDRNMKILVCN